MMTAKQKMSRSINLGRIFYILFVIAASLAVYGFSQRQESIDKKALVHSTRVTIRKTKALLAKQERKDHAALLSSQYKGCLRGNDLRRQINGGDEVIAGILQSVVVSSRTRAKIDKGAARKHDLEFAKIYAKKAAKFKTVSVTNCDKVILGITTARNAKN